MMNAWVCAETGWIVTEGSGKFFQLHAHTSTVKLVLPVDPVQELGSVTQRLGGKVLECYGG